MIGSYLGVHVVPDNLTHLLPGNRRAHLEHHPCSNNFAVVFVWDRDNCRFSYRRVGGQNVLYLNGEQILAENSGYGRHTYRLTRAHLSTTNDDILV